MHARVCVGLLATVLLCGCLGAGIRSPAAPAAALLPSHASSIRIGETERDAVRRLLGAPVRSSAFRRMALYRTQVAQHESAFAITPIPVPFARVADHIERHTLVLFDAKGRVADVDTGLFRRPAARRGAAPIEHDHPWLKLRAGDLPFFLMPYGERGENLLAGPASRDVYLAAQRATAPWCSVAARADVANVSRSTAGRRCRFPGGCSFSRARANPDGRPSALNPRPGCRGCKPGCPTR